MEKRTISKELFEAFAAQIPKRFLRKDDHAPAGRLPGWLDRPLTSAEYVLVRRLKRHGWSDEKIKRHLKAETGSS